MESLELANKAADLIFNKKGFDVKILDLRELTTITDFFVIGSGDSDTQVKAIADEVDHFLRDEGIKSWHKEGFQGLNWVLLDYVDVVVHIFKKDSREFYGLEKLWGDAPTIDVVDPILRKKQEAEEKPKVKRTRKTTAKSIEVKEAESVSEAAPTEDRELEVKPKRTRKTKKVSEENTSEEQVSSEEVKPKTTRKRTKKDSE